MPIIPALRKSGQEDQVQDRSQLTVTCGPACTIRNTFCLKIHVCMHTCTYMCVRLSSIYKDNLTIIKECRSPEDSSADKGTCYTSLVPQAGFWEPNVKNGRGDLTPQGCLSSSPYMHAVMSTCTRTHTQIKKCKLILH